eukprot:m.68795 g.68795  ORF g.68795 m.68795 type:complete len:228 (+) comp12001_c0_seq4:117-800(+)
MKRPQSSSLYSGLVHAVDILPTFLRLATKGSQGDGPDAKWRNDTIYPKDGIDFWDALCAGHYTSNRTEVPVWIGQDSYAIRMRLDAGDFKLIVGGDNDGWYVPPNASGEAYEIEGTGCGSLSSLTADDANVAGDDDCMFLFDMFYDPEEKYNLLNGGNPNHPVEYNMSITEIVYTMQSRMSDLYVLCSKDFMKHVKLCKLAGTLKPPMTIMAEMMKNIKTSPKIMLS